MSSPHGTRDCIRRPEVDITMKAAKERRDARQIAFFAGERSGYGRAVRTRVHPYSSNDARASEEATSRNCCKRASHNITYVYTMSHVRLFVRFAAAHRDFMMMDGDTMDFRDMTQKDFHPTPAVFTDDDVHEQIEISKELFLVAAWPSNKPC